MLNYTGLSPQDMQDRLANVIERNSTTTVNDIEHIEAQSYHGIAVVKIFFQPGANVFGAHGAGRRHCTAGHLADMPPGTTPPYMLALQRRRRADSADRPEQQDALGAAAAGFGRRILSARGSRMCRESTIPRPYGGKNRLITVDLDPQKLLQRDISGADVVSAVNSQNLVLPQGTAKIGDREYDVALNSSAKTVDELTMFP